MSPETPRDEELTEDLAIDVDSPTNNSTLESAAINSYDDNNDEEADETTSLLKKRGTEIPLISDNSGTKISKKKKKFFSLKNFIKLILFLAFIALIVWLLVFVKIQDHIKKYLRLVEAHKQYGVLIYVAIYTVCIWLFIPGSIISIAAGFLFKPLILAGAVIIVGDILGALGTFLFGRYIFSDWVKAQIVRKPVFAALNSVIAEEGWKIVVMLRLTPLPFNLISYFFSVSSIELFPFLWATVLGVLPGTFNAVWIGSLVKNLSGIDKPKLENKDIVIITMNLILVGCCVIALSIFGKRSLRNAMMKLSASKEPESDSSDNDDATTNSPTDVPPIEEESPPYYYTAPFTRTERIILITITIIAILDLMIALPLYFHYKSQTVISNPNVIFVV